MQPSLAQLLRDWHDFYILVGTASATLVGLMFVAASVGAQIFDQQDGAALQAFISPTVVHFSSSLFVSILVMVPVHTFSTLAVLLVLAGLSGCGYSGRVWMQLFVRRRFKVDVIDRLFYALVPLAGYVLIVVAAGLLFERTALALVALAAALIVLLGAGVRNAWDMTIWIVLKAPRLVRRSDPAAGGESGPQR